MANKKISELNPATLPLAGSEVVPIVQGGETKKVAIEEIATVEPTIETTLPATIPIDGTKTYHIESGVIKPATSGNLDTKDVEIVSNPLDAATLAVDLTDYPYVTLQGGGFTESPPNYYTLDTDEQSGYLRQHLTLMSWRRGNLFISNVPNLIPNSDINFTGTTNTDNQYVSATFNKVIQQTDLVLGNFTAQFTQNGDAATGVTLDSVTDSSGATISADTNAIRVYFTVAGDSDGQATFTLTAATLSDNFGNTETNVLSSSIALQPAEIENLSNVVEYWKEGFGDNTTGIATKTGAKNSKVLSAAGESNPTLATNEWSFNGTNQGFRIIDTDINTLLNADTKEMQIHFKGTYNTTGTRLVVGTDVGVSPASLWNMIYRSDTSQLALSLFDANGDSINQTLADASAGVEKVISLKFHQKDLGSGVVNAIDMYVKTTGGATDSVLDIDASNINASAISELFVGMRETTSKSFYNVKFKSLVIANNTDNFDFIKDQL